LQFCANNCDGPCAWCHLHKRLTADKFTRSLCTEDLQAVDRQQSPAPQPLSPSAPDSDSADSAEDDRACFFDEFDTLPPSSFPAPQPVVKFSQKFSPLPDAAAFLTRPRDPVILSLLAGNHLTHSPTTRSQMTSCFTRCSLLALPHPFLPSSLPVVWSLPTWCVPTTVEFVPPSMLMKMRRIPPRTPILRKTS